MTEIVDLARYRRDRRRDEPQAIPAPRFRIGDSVRHGADDTRAGTITRLLGWSPNREAHYYTIQGTAFRFVADETRLVPA